LKAETTTDRFFKKQKTKEYGHTSPRSKLDETLCRYKQPQRVILEEFQKSALPEDRLYMIDKVVRMRGLHGRFGVDHSELLNYEIE
jgi:hypothetical protein